MHAILSNSSQAQITAAIRQIGIQFDTNSGDKEVSNRRKKETRKRVSPFNLAGVFIRLSFSSYITHSVRVRKISLRSAVEIGKISLAEVSRRRCRRNGDDAGEVGGFLGNRCARRHRGNFLIWNFRKPRFRAHGDDVNFQKEDQYHGATRERRYRITE